ncbi:hypothetical protein GCM10023195_84150 [Actinoallomurus liliacearum]|uniref:Uncharacterized protein n=1 Tax=Actinoallomurus liliacearum TaxID=1080073 RepID=A0ABP8U181_9ACTN
MWNVDRLMTPAAGAQLYDVAWYSFVMRSRWDAGGTATAGDADALGVGAGADAAVTGRVRSAERRVSPAPVVHPARTSAVAAASPATHRPRSTLCNFAPIRRIGGQMMARSAIRGIDFLQR